VFSGNAGAVHHAPEVGFKQAAVVGHGNVGELAVYGDAGVVDPGIEAPERTDCQLGGRLQGGFVGHVGHRVHGLGAVNVQFSSEFTQGLLIAGHQYEFGAAPGGHAGSYQPDAAGGPGNHDDLLV
jgi:hypothetical protein